MQEIKLNNVEFSNILSYGNNINRFVFKDGMNLITGHNGTGKSVLIDVLHFAFFKSPYRKILLIKLKNNTNKSNLKVVLDFDVITSKGTDNFVITRTMTNSGTINTKISKNGIEQKKEALISQKKFEEDVLSFNSNIFKNIISLNAIDTKPIIEMEPKDSRKLFESFLTLYTDKYKDLNNKKCNEANANFDNATSDLYKYRKDADELEIILAQLAQEQQDDITSLNKELDELNLVTKEYLASALELDNEKKVVTNHGLIVKNKFDSFNESQKLLDRYKEIETYNNLKSTYDSDIERLNKELEIYDADVKNAKQKLDAINIENIENYDNVLKEISKNNATIVETKSSLLSEEKELKHVVEEGKALKAGVPCPTCKKETTKEEIELLKGKLRDKYKISTETVKTLKSSLIIIEDINTKLLSGKEILDKSKKDYDLLKQAHVNEVAKYDKVLIDIQSVDRLKNEIDKQYNLTEEESGLDFIKISKFKHACEDSLKEKEKVTEELNELRTKLNTINVTIKNNQDLIDSNNKRISNINDKIKEKESKDTKSAYTSTETKLKETLGDLERAKNRIIKYSEEIDITEFIKTMYDDKGINKIVLAVFVPNLNKAIAYNLALFELPFSIEFNDAMEYKFSNKFGLSDCYGGLSKGQQRKLNFVVSLAFRDFVTSIAGFKINMLFLDEVLDISTDDESLEQMVQLLVTKAPEIGAIYVMSHRDKVIYHYFDTNIHMDYDGVYSTMTVS